MTEAAQAPTPPPGGMPFFPPGEGEPLPPPPPVESTEFNFGEDLEVEDPDGRWTADFEGLLYLGRLSGSFSWLGHRIAIRTLSVAEELTVFQLVREYQDTLGANRAYSTAMAAMAVQSVDGRPLPVPLGETGDEIEWARQRFAFAQRWYAWTIDTIFTKYLELEARVREVLDEMGKASPGTGPGSNVTSGSPSGAGSSPGDTSP